MRRLEQAVDIAIDPWVAARLTSGRIDSKREACFEERAGRLENSLRDWLAAQT